jgi:hypothetical protein
MRGGAITKCIHPAIMHFINPDASPPMSRHHLHQPNSFVFSSPDRLVLRTVYKGDTERVITARGCFVFVNANTRKINCNCIWLLYLLCAALMQTEAKSHISICILPYYTTLIALLRQISDM